MNEDKMRKDFEALCEKRWAGSRGVFAIREDGEYENGNVQFGWACYQAATRAAVPDEIRRLADVMLRESQGVPVLTDWHESARTVCEWVASAPEVKP